MLEAPSRLYAVRAISMEPKMVLEGSPLQTAVSMDRGRGAFEDKQCWTGIYGAAQLHGSLQEKMLKFASWRPSPIFSTALQVQNLEPISSLVCEQVKVAGNW